MIWYVERRFAGKYQPALLFMENRPAAQNFFREGTPVEVPDWMLKMKPVMNLDEIRLCLSPDGEVYGMSDEIHKALVHYRRHGDV